MDINNNIIKLSPKQFLEALAFFTDNVKAVIFDNGTQKFGYFPDVSQWSAGNIQLTTANAQVADKVKEYLQKSFGIIAKTITINEKVSRVEFSARAGDYIIDVLAKAMDDKKLQKDLFNVKWELDGLTPQVDAVISLSKYTKPSLCSRGVKDLKKAIVVLKNIRTMHENQH